MVNESLYMKNRDLNVYSLSKINGDHQHNKDSRTSWQERNTQMTLSCIHGALSIQDLMHTPNSLSIGEVHGFETKRSYKEATRLHIVKQ